MHEYGTTSRQLARIAGAMRRHAARNPGARCKEPITVDDVLASRLIAENQTLARGRGMPCREG
jgi:acetyl-CoA acetyltransferase